MLKTGRTHDNFVANRATKHSLARKPADKPRNYKKCWKKQIIVAATKSKLRDIEDGILRVDAGEETDKMLRGYRSSCGSPRMAPYACPMIRHRTF